MNRIISRLNKKARFRRTANDVDDFIQQCEDSGKFDDDQMKEIRLGFQNGLIIKQVKIYADPKFSYKQMARIREDLEDGYNIEEVKEKYDL